MVGQEDNFQNHWPFGQVYVAAVRLDYYTTTHVRKTLRKRKVEISSIVEKKRENGRGGGVQAKVLAWI